MKTLLSFAILLVLLFISPLQAQDQYTVDGQTYTLKTEVSGTMTLLWNTINGEYRFFAKKGSAITELKNTRSNGKYQEEYKEALELMTNDQGMSADKVKLTTGSLRNFFDDYNKRVDPNYTPGTTAIRLKTRLGAFAGISNNIYTTNPDNSFLPVAGVEFELIENENLRRHSLVFRFRQTFESSDFKYQASQFSMNYRFKFVQTPKLDVFVNTKVVTLTHVKRDIMVVTPLPMGGSVTTIESVSGSDFSAPVAFGLGADIAVGNGYVTLGYNDIVAIGIDGNGEFPIDFTVGYKFNL